MSDSDNPPAVPTQTPAPPPGMPPPRNGCLTALMVLVGIVLLLPGLCAVIFGGMALTQPRFDSGFMPFVVVGLLVGFGGIMLIRAAFRGPRP